MRVIKRAVERVKVRMMPVKDFGSWIRKLEAMEAICVK